MYKNEVNVSAWFYRNVDTGKTRTRERTGSSGQPLRDPSSVFHLAVLETLSRWSMDSNDTSMDEDVITLLGESRVASISE